MSIANTIDPKGRSGTSRNKCYKSHPWNGHKMGFFFERSRLNSQKRANGIPIQIQAQTFLRALKPKEEGTGISHI